MLTAGESGLSTLWHHAFSLAWLVQVSGRRLVSCMAICVVHKRHLIAYRGPYRSFDIPHLPTNAE